MNALNPAYGWTPIVYSAVLFAPTPAAAEFTTVNGIIRIPESEEFAWTHTTGSSSPASTRVLISDSVNGRMFNTPVILGAVAGSGQLPHYLPEVYVFPRGSIIDLTASATLNDGSLSVSLALHGFSRRAQPWGRV